MNDDYLWDRTGEADPEIARLEHLLRPLAHDGRPLDLRPTRPLSRAGLSARQWGPPLALAAAVVLMVAGVWTARDGGAATWTIEAIEGTPRIASQAVGKQVRAQPGGLVETDAGSRARLALDGVGSVEVGPNSRMRLPRTRTGAIRLRLDAGSLDATISAAPGLFSVDTPASRAVDLGCKYTLDVDANGSGVLHVTLGWVGLQWKGRESLVPAGALCATRAAQGPGTPRFEGATPAFVEALSAIDGSVDAGREVALTALLNHARPLDAITLWHLLSRMDRASAGRIYDRLAVLVPPPAGVTRDGVLRGDQPALRAWWEGLGLGDLEELRKGLRGSYR